VTAGATMKGPLPTVAEEPGGASECAPGLRRCRPRCRSRDEEGGATTSQGNRARRDRAGEAAPRLRGTCRRRVSPRRWLQPTTKGRPGGVVREGEGEGRRASTRTDTYSGIAAGRRRRRRSKLRRRPTEQLVAGSGGGEGSPRVAL
jgi:hypothetical protein